MEDVAARLEAVEARVKDLLETFSRIKEENTKLREENKSLVHDLEQLRKAKVRLEGQLAESLAASRTRKVEDEDRAKLKRELGQYVKEIDKCILMLGDI